MSLKAVATSASSSLEPASTCTPSSPRGDPLRGGLEPAQRPHEDLREHEREQADEDDHGGGREDQVAGEVLDGHQRLGRGLLRDDHPVQAVDVERRVRGEAVAAEVVALEQRAVLAGERLRHGVARDRLLQQRVAVLHAQRGGGRREARGDGILLDTRRGHPAAAARWTA